MKRIRDISALMWPVLRKELIDALRDRRSLLIALLSSVLIGPLMLLALSQLAADIESRAAQREIHMRNAAQAPTLVNYLQRQGRRIVDAPADAAAALASQRFNHAVLLVPDDFERQLAAGLPPRLQLLSSSRSTLAEASARQWQALLAGFSQEQALLRLTSRGVAPPVLQAIRVDEQDMADAGQRAGQFMRSLPLFVLMAVLYGALAAALDTTAGERERGTLEPLLLTPAPRLALVLGKWAAVALLAMAVAVLSCLSFLPGQWLLRSESLAAMFHFGTREAALFLALLLPLAAALSALLMAVAQRSRSVKEAQASTAAVLLLVSLLPLMALLNLGGERPWQLWLPALAQVTLMQRVLEGAAIGLADLMLPLATCVALTLLCLADLTRQLTRAAGGR